MSIFSRLFRKKQPEKPIQEQLAELILEQYRLFFAAKELLKDRTLPYKKRHTSSQELLNNLRNYDVIKKIEHGEPDVNAFYDPLCAFHASISLMENEFSTLNGKKKTEDIDEIEGNIAAHLTQAENKIIDIYKQAGLGLKVDETALALTQQRTLLFNYLTACEQLLKKCGEANPFDEKGAQNCLQELLDLFEKDTISDILTKVQYPEDLKNQILSFCKRMETTRTSLSKMKNEEKRPVMTSLYETAKTLRTTAPR